MVRFGTLMGPALHHLGWEACSNDSRSVPTAYRYVSWDRSNGTQMTSSGGVRTTSPDGTGKEKEGLTPPFAHGYRCSDRPDLSNER